LEDEGTSPAGVVCLGTNSLVVQIEEPRAEEEEVLARSVEEMEKPQIPEDP